VSRQGGETDRREEETIVIRVIDLGWRGRRELAHALVRVLEMSRGVRDGVRGRGEETIS
jgi:hypothetical protein